MPHDPVRIIYDVHPTAFRYDPAIRRLLGEHYNELCIDKEGNTLAPLWEQYEAHYNAGSLLTVVVIDNATQQPIGYSASILGDSLHYGGTRVAKNDVIYLDPLWRGEKIDLKELTENHARQRGAAAYLWHSKPGTALHAICEAEGLPVQDVIHYKRL